MAGQCVLFGAPWLFNGMWKMVKPLLNDVTASKVLFLEGAADKPSKWTPVLEEHWPTNLVEWTVKEMQENRQKLPLPKEYWKAEHPDGSAKTHDSRAEKSYVESPWFVSPVNGLDAWSPPDGTRKTSKIKTELPPTKRATQPCIPHVRPPFPSSFPLLTMCSMRFILWIV
jgi:hypothetical protein